MISNRATSDNLFFYGVIEILIYGRFFVFLAFNISKNTKNSIRCDPHQHTKLNLKKCIFLSIRE